MQAARFAASKLADAEAVYAAARRRSLLDREVARAARVHEEKLLHAALGAPHARASSAAAPMSFLPTCSASSTC
jgi:hypothetical protein